MAEEGIYAGADGAGAGAGEPSSGGGVGAKTPPLLIAGQPAARVGGAAAVLAAVVLVVVLASGGDEAAADAAADGSPQGPRLVTSWGGAGGSGAGGQVARVTISASHMQNSHTGGYVFASIAGTAGSSSEVLVGHGIAERTAYSVYIAVSPEQVGTPTGLTLRLVGNDGLHVAETVLELGGQTYDWPEPLWLDGDDEANPPSRDYLLSRASTLLTGSGTTLRVGASSGNWAEMGAGQATFVTVYGSRGHVGPLPLTNPTDGPRAVTQLQTADLGTISSVKVVNEGPSEWELQALDLQTQAGQGDPTNELAWTYDGWLDSRAGGSSRHAPHSWTFYSERAVRPTAAGEMMCVVALTASALQSSNTPGDIFVTLTGSTGATREMLVTSGITQRQTVTTPVCKCSRSLCVFF